MDKSNLKPIKARASASRHNFSSSEKCDESEEPETGSEVKVVPNRPKGRFPRAPHVHGACWSGTNLSGHRCLGTVDDICDLVIEMGENNDIASDLAALWNKKFCTMKDNGDMLRNLQHRAAQQQEYIRVCRKNEKQQSELLRAFSAAEMAHLKSIFEERAAQNRKLMQMCKELQTEITRVEVKFHRVQISNVGLAQEVIDRFDAVRGMPEDDKLRKCAMYHKKVKSLQREIDHLKKNAKPVKVLAVNKNYEGSSTDTSESSSDKPTNEATQVINEMSALIRKQRLRIDELMNITAKTAPKNDKDVAQSEELAIARQKDSRNEHLLHKVKALMRVTHSMTVLMEEKCEKVILALQDSETRLQSKKRKHLEQLRTIDKLKRNMRAKDEQVAKLAKELAALKKEKNAINAKLDMKRQDNDKEEAAKKSQENLKKLARESNVHLCVDCYKKLSTDRPIVRNVPASRGKGRHQAIRQGYQVAAKSDTKSEDRVEIGPEGDVDVVCSDVFYEASDEL